MLHHTMETVGESNGLVEKERNTNVNYYQWRNRNLASALPDVKSNASGKMSKTKDVFPPHSYCVLNLPGKHI